MAVATVVRFQVSPGRQLEFMKLVGEAKGIHEGLGGKVRVWNATIAGPDSNTVSYVIEHKDMAAFAAFTDKMAADAKWLAFAARVFNADPASRVLSSVLITEAAV